MPNVKKKKKKKEQNKTKKIIKQRQLSFNLNLGKSLRKLFPVLGSDEGAVFGSLITNASGSSKKEGAYGLFWSWHVESLLIVKTDYRWCLE